jgi:type IV pilus assembly protein PilQ
MVFFLIKNKKFFLILCWTIFYLHCSLAQPLASKQKKISLNLQEVSIPDALRILAKFSNINLFVSPTIHGVTSLHLEQVYASEALNLLLASNELSRWQMGNVLYVMPRVELLQHKQEELKLQSIVEEVAPLLSRVWQIHYAKADDIARLLQDSHSSLLSKRGHIEVDVRTNIICVQDTEDRLHEIYKLIQRLDVPVKQVLIEVHLASIDSDFERALGINFSEQQANPSESSILTNSSGPVMHYGLAILKLTDGSLLHMQLSALESKGHGELISSPCLFTANQQTASIESGEEIPYQEVSRTGATGVAFKKAVLSLRVTPQVMPGGQVLLRLQINQDKPSSRVVMGVPAITTRQISTNILVKNGQTIVLGGIYEANNEHQQQSVPFLGKIPLVGWLFKQQNVTDKKRELLIFVTPKIIT